jgi:uncharacterized protein (DUF952 family)
MTTSVYKICDAALWHAAELAGTFVGAGIDLSDGFIHFSAADQVAETAAKHFSGQRNLVLVAVAVDALGAALKWETSRAGALFPHLYGSLPMTAVKWVKPLALDADGRVLLPDLAH